MDFSDALAMDNVTGRVPATVVSVDLENDSFVFTADQSAKRPTTILDVEPPRAEAFVAFSRIDADAAKKCREEKRPFSECLVRGLLDFAKKTGPLFGLRGLSEDGARIVEPIEDWRAAQMAMSTALKLAAFVRHGEIDPKELDDVAGNIVQTTSDGGIAWSYYLNLLPERPGAIYEGILLPEYRHSYTSEDRSILHSWWFPRGASSSRLLDKSPILSGPEARKRITGGLVAALTTEYPPDHYGAIDAGSRDRYMPMSGVSGIEGIVEEIDSLLKIVSEGHLGGMKLGFRNPFSVAEDRSHVSYGILSDSYLSYMWHELCQSYSRRSFRICANPKCEAVISINSGTSSGKRFCCAACRAQANNLKLSAQNKRARDAYYEGLSWAEIYERAFKKAPTQKDPKFAALSQRLDRWIESDFSRTKKGAKASKRGAGRE